MNQSTAIAIRDDQTTFDDLQKRALAHIGVETANPADLAVFFHTCKRTGLDPFARQIYMIRRDGKQTMQTGIDGLRLVAQRTAERTGDTFGYDDTLWCGEDGQWVDAWLAPHPPRAAKATVIRNGQRFPAVALFDEYVQRKRDGNITQMWASKGALMLAKCAEASALRKAFPQDLSGIYTADELTEAPRETAPTVTAAAFRQAAPSSTPATEGEQPSDMAADEVTGEIIEDDAADVSEQPKITPAQQRRLFALFAQKGIADADQLSGMAHILGRPIESRTAMTADEYALVTDHLEQLPDAQAGDES